MAVMPAENRLHDQVIEITAEYLGPAAERFIDRQIETHIHKRPSELTKRDLRKLIEWIKLAISMLTDDIVTVDEYVESLEKIAREKPAANRS